MAKEIWGYARVSTKEQNLERQLVELRRYVPKEEKHHLGQTVGQGFRANGL